ncbi:Daple [Paractinoplanes lichenicola]|uniref:Daple n=1 Tax=Paractinoplanes lichenicola TaxID=2802976 RepID=A0ABS1VR92_9ACTN|nr:Daple [Actinoplanes lichenicola]MBL7257134.1 Daple [Actinoplanes lichenicola]
MPLSNQPVSAQPSSSIPAPAPAPPGFVDAKPSGEIPSSGEPAPGSRWDRSRFSELLSPLTPPEQPRPEQPRQDLPRPEQSRQEQSRADLPRPQPAPASPAPPAQPTPRESGLGTGGLRPDREPGLSTGSRRPDREPGLGTGGLRPDREPGLGSGNLTPGLRAFDVPTPNSAPPYPYEGDLDDQPPPPPPIVQQRAAVPLVRPATPGGGRRADWGTAEHSTTDPRHALSGGTGVQGVPRVASDEPGPARPAYDPSSFPRRLSYEPPPPYEVPKPYEPPAPVPSPPEPSSYSGFGETTARLDPAAERGLPQRVPAQPDVPKGVPEPPLVEATAETPALARIATHLRRGDVLPVQERQEGFDVQAILAAVREVDGVRDASLRSTPTGAHSLRLDLAEGADPAEVSRQVARLLQDRMGLDAAMPGEAPPPAEPPLAAAPVSPPALVPRVRQAEQVSAPPVSQTPLADSIAPERERETRERETRERETREREAREREIREAREREARDRHADAARLVPEVDESAEVVPTGVDCGPPRPLYPNEHPGPRVVIENVHVNTFGADATVEVKLAVGGRTASGTASGPAVDGYLLRLCAMATAGAVDELLSHSDHPDGPARCFVEHAAAVPFGAAQVAVVVLLLSCGGWVEQLAGSAVVTSDDRHAMVRATLAAVNRRLEALLTR